MNKEDHQFILKLSRSGETYLSIANMYGVSPSRIQQIIKSMVGIQNKNLSDGLKQKWASGTRKKNPNGYGKKGGAVRAKMMKDGRMRIAGMTSEQARERQAMVDKEKQLKVNQELGKKRVGIKMTTPLSAKGPDHHKSKYWIVRNESLGVTIQGLNLNDLVRNNSHLFDDADLNWKRYRCKATKGLRGLFEIKKSTGKPVALSWKGWTPVDVLDKDKINRDKK